MSTATTTITISRETFESLSHRAAQAHRYLDHREEIEAQIAENRIERALQDSGATMSDEGVIKLPNGG